MSNNRRFENFHLNEGRCKGAFFAKAAMRNIDPCFNNCVPQFALIIFGRHQASFLGVDGCRNGIDPFCVGAGDPIKFVDNTSVGATRPAGGIKPVLWIFVCKQSVRTRCAHDR